MSGLQSALARIGAIERMVSGVQAPAVRVADGGGATSFADALDQATLLDSAGSSSPVAPATAPAATSADATAGMAIPLRTGSTVLRALPAGVRRDVGARTSVVSPASVATAGTASASATERRTTASGSAAYRPAHVTETDERVWNDCTWASAAMWIDKLTGGSVKVDREALRAASGDRTGGSSLGDVVRGARKLLGLDLREAHDERLTVNELLDRLASGGGAIVQGSYASLPAHLTRHDPGFAAKGVAGSGHAVYVGPLDRSTGKVWWDDPLARAGGSGEWISVKDLKAFMWTDAHGRVSALATPEGGGASSASGATSLGAGATSAAISAAATKTGVDPLLLTAYLDVTGAASGGRAASAAADVLAAAMAQYGRADLALESIGAAQAGATRLAEGAVFAGDVLTRWAELVGRSAGG